MSSLAPATRKVFITVKTYPTLSTKYDEIVCTAGILDDGSWARIYPLPFRKLEYDNRYHKYQWLELPLEKNLSDPRPESYKVLDLDQIRILGEPVGTEQGWMQRKEIIFAHNPVYEDLTQLIALAKENTLSLAIFKPTELIDLICKPVDRQWKPSRLALLQAKASQLQLFQTEEEVRQEFLVVDKLPYKFSYRFVDNQGKESTQMIEDWEIGMLYWHCLERTQGDENAAIELVRNKYLDEFSGKDLYLFLGTTKQFHGWASNPFIIVGVFYPPDSPQQSLL